MDFNASPLYADVLSVMDSKHPESWFSYEAKLVLGNGEILEAIKVVNLDWVENYKENYSDVRFIELIFGLGTYVKKIYPSRENLELILYKTVWTGNDYEQTSMNYRAILLNEENPSVDGSGLSDSEEFTLDVSSLSNVKFQIVDKVIDQLRSITVGGVYRYCTVKDVLQTALSNALSQIETDSDLSPLGVDLADDYNERVYEQIVIPHGTSIMDLPGYLQEKAGGIYATGLGHFFKDRIWFIYPVYDTEGYNEDDEQCLEVVLVPQNRFEVLDRTYAQYGSVTIVIAAGDRSNNRENENHQQNEGEGTRFTNAKRLISGFVDTTQENKAIISRGSNTNEYVTEESKSGYANARMSDNAITDNQFRELSKLASLKGTYFTSVWNHSNPDRVRPGMMGRIKFMDGEELRVVEGTLCGSMSTAQLYGNSLTSQSHVHSTSFTFFIERDLGMSLVQ